MKTEFTLKEKLGISLLIIGTWSILHYREPAVFGDTIASNVYIWTWFCMLFISSGWRIDGASNIINEDTLCPKGKVIAVIITSLIASFIASIILMLVICIPHDLILTLFNPLNVIYKKKIYGFLFYTYFMHSIIGKIIYCRDN